jgi:predicted nucleic acid-binding protein
MAIILDTNVIIRGERETLDIEGWFETHSDDQFEIAAITVADLWHGVERADAANRAKREKYVRSVIEQMLVIPYTEAIALEHARIWAELESSGEMIGYYDLIVAATALERGSSVATFNERHFMSVRGLKVIKAKA